jgi:hypothetical protein
MITGTMPLNARNCYVYITSGVMPNRVYCQPLYLFSASHTRLASANASAPPACETRLVDWTWWVNTVPAHTKR